MTAYIGHGPETLYLPDKAGRVARFYQSATPAAERQALLAEGGIDFVIDGPRERALGDLDPAGLPYLSLIYAADGYRIFEVRP